MSLGSAIKSAVSNIGTAVKNTVSTVVEKVKSADKALGGGNDTLSRQLAAGAKSAAVAVGIGKVAEVPAVATAVGSAAASAAKAVKSTVKTAISNATPAQKVGGALVVTTAAGAVASNPKLLSSAADFPSDVFNFGYNVGELTKEPSYSNAAQIFKDNPLIAGTVVAGGAIIAGTGITKAVTTLTNTMAIKDLTQSLQDSQTVNAVLPAESVTPGSVLSTKTGASTDMPITPATQIVGKSASTKVSYSKYKRRKILIPNIRVNVINNSRLMKITKYIN